MASKTAQPVRCAIYTRKSTDMALNWNSIPSMRNGKLARPTSNRKPMKAGKQ